MSVIKNKVTEYHPDAQDVKYKISFLKIDRLDKLQNLMVRGGLVGRVGDTDGVVEYKYVELNLQELLANTTVTERNKIKAAIAIFERELIKKDAELAGETHDDSDVFVS